MLLEIDHLSKTYKSGVHANNDISLSVDGGEVFGLLGPNGAGKTTLVNQVLGSVVPTEGSISIKGVDVVKRPAFAREACSYQPQTSVPLEGLTPLQSIEMAGRIHGARRAEARSRAAELIEGLGLGEWANKVVPLSGGVGRLVAFCMAAVVPGRVVILDEPTNDVDPLRRKLLWATVRKLADGGSAVLLVTHNVLEAERCVDRLAIIDSGRVLTQGTTAAVKAGHGGVLRLEILVEPDSHGLETPAFVQNVASSGRRLFGDIGPETLPIAIEWATRLRNEGKAEEFSIGPVTLEDVYVRHVKTEGEIEAKVSA